MESFNDYPKAASTNAQRAIDYKEDNDDKGGCGTQVGWVRARQLADRKPISFDTVKRMANFQRFEQYKDDPYEDADGQANCGRIMWDAWGGTEGVNWAIRKVEQVEKQQQENKTELYLDKPVGQGVDPWTGEKMMSLDDVKAQIGSGEDLKIILKSPGGSVVEGFAMADMLRAHSADVEIIGTGIVGSIATMIFAAGTPGKRKLTQNAFFMIHKPSSGLGGTADDLRSEADILDNMDGVLVSNYVDLIESNDKLINGSREETETQLREWMAAEKWFNAKEAVAVGLADGIAEGDYMTEKTARSFAAMASHYKNTPAQFTNYIKTFEMQEQNNTELPVDTEESKSFLSKFMNHMKAFFTGAKAEAENMCEEDYDKEDSIIENKNEEMKKDNMTKEELMEMAKEMGLELVEMSEESKEEKMSKEDLLALAESMGMKEKKEDKGHKEEEKAEVVAEQTAQVDEIKALKEELARMKAMTHKAKTQALSGKKKEITTTNRDRALDEIVNKNDGFAQAVVDGLGSYFGK